MHAPAVTLQEWAHAPYYPASVSRFPYIWMKPAHTLCSRVCSGGPRMWGPNSHVPQALLMEPQQERRGGVEIQSHDRRILAATIKILVGVTPLRQSEHLRPHHRRRTLAVINVTSARRVSIEQCPAFRARTQLSPTDLQREPHDTTHGVVPILWNFWSMLCRFSLEICT